MKQLRNGLALLCFVPILAIPAHFVLHIPDGAEPWKEQPLAWLGSNLIPVFMVLILTVVPFGLYFGTRYLCSGIGSSLLRGLLVALVVMLWCDTVLIAVPSVGVYTSYPSVKLAYRFSGSQSSARNFWLWVFALNAVIWLTL